ncbi:hypothetical protein IZY60_15160 [Lutibacter sp. B2]|nr:hypothetical protein [Lutibacter sp. B2]
MTTQVTRPFLEFAEEEMTKQLLRFSKRGIKEEKATKMAKEVVSNIDWNNSALMHKGLSWIVKNYLEQIEV